MIKTIGFNGVLPDNININMLFKPHDSGYKSFTATVNTVANGFHPNHVGVFGFLQIVVEESSGMVIQNIFYTDGNTGFRVGDVNNGTVTWSEWNNHLLVSDSGNIYTQTDIRDKFLYKNRSEAIANNLAVDNYTLTPSSKFITDDAFFYDDRP